MRREDDTEGGAFSSTKNEASLFLLGQCCWTFCKTAGPMGGQIPSPVGKTFLSQLYYTKDSNQVLRSRHFSDSVSITQLVD